MLPVSLPQQIDHFLQPVGNETQIAGRFGTRNGLIVRVNCAGSRRTIEATTKPTTSPTITATILAVTNIALNRADVMSAISVISRKMRAKLSRNSMPYLFASATIMSCSCRNRTQNEHVPPMQWRG